MGMLYIIGTPIGNLEDITLRALRILKEADVVLCEDTRVTKRLLERYDIDTPMLSYHAQSGEMKTEKILEQLREGKTLALVSDAGTPGIQDPGSKLVSQVREEIPDVEIISVPGPSALTAAISISGTPLSEFLFLGFLPHKKRRETLFREIASTKRPVIFYESPHRILKTLASLEEHVGERGIILARELTKIHENIMRGKARELKKEIESEGKVKGEFVVIVERA